MGQKSFIDLGVVVLRIRVTTAVLKFLGKILSRKNIGEKKKKRNKKQTEHDFAGISKSGDG